MVLKNDNQVCLTSIVGVSREFEFSLMASRQQLGETVSKYDD